MFRTLHYVNEVYKTKSFSKAAQNLFISQSSLSLTIKKFEKDIGITIFDRSTTPIQLTEAGKTYMKGILRILEIENDLINYVDDYNDLKTGKFTIGAPDFFSSFLLPSLIAKFYKKFPFIEIKLVDKDSISLDNMIMKGELDFIVESNEFDEKYYKTHRLLSEHILIAIPNSNPINKSLKGFSMTRDDIINNRHLDNCFSPIPIKYLRNSNFILLEKGHDMYQRANKLFQKYNFEPKVLMYLNQLITSYSMTNQQLGISFVSDTLVKLIDFGNRVTYYNIDEELSNRYIYLAYKQNRYVSKPMQEFINIVLNTDYKNLNKLD